MSLKRAARDFADDVAKQAITGLFGLIERRLAWRQAHPHRLAIYHQRYAYLLETDPRRRAARDVRVRWHLNQAQRFAARAWALDAELAARMNCPRCLPEES